VNHYIFVFPFLIPFSVLLCIDILRLKLWKDQTVLFFILTGACAIVFGFLVKSDLGLSRDWDIFSLFIIPAILFIIIWILRIGESSIQKQVFLIIIMTTLAHTGTWIYVNSDHEKSFHYFRSLPNNQLWSKKANANAHSELARFYEQSRNYEASLFEYQEYIRYDSKNLRIWENMGGTYFYIFKDSVNAQKAYEKCVEGGRKSWIVFANLGEIYLSQNRLDSALNLLNRSLELNPNNDAAKNIKSLILARTKQK
jgi:tetratricopeptide (TPR) repeat protein